MMTNSKLREALEASTEMLEKLAELGDESAEEQIEKNRAILSSSIRLNCEVGTAKEQNQRFDWYCLSRGCGNCPLLDEDSCKFAWAQMPYVEKEGGAK